MKNNEWLEEYTKRTKNERPNKFSREYEPFYEDIFHTLKIESDEIFTPNKALQNLSKELFEELYTWNSIKQSSREHIFRTLEESLIDQNLLERLYSVDTNISQQNFQYLLLFSSILWKNLEDWIRKVIFHIEFCKNHWRALERFLWWKVVEDTFDINNNNQQWFQRILKTIWIEKNKLSYEFRAIMIRNNSISEHWNDTKNNTSNIFYQFDEDEKKLTASWKHKEKMKRIELNDQMIESIITLWEENTGFLQNDLDKAIVIFQEKMKEQLWEMTFKQKVIIIEFLIMNFIGSKLAYESSIHFKNNWENLRKEILRKNISFNHPVEMSAKGPWIICKFKTVEDAKKVFPKFSWHLLTNAHWKIHSYWLKKWYEIFTYKLICIIEENITDTSNDFLTKLIDHELFHIYQQSIKPFHKTIISLDQLQLEIKSELAARASETRIYKPEELDDIAYGVTRHYDNMNLESSLTDSELEDRIHTQVDSLKELFKRYNSAKVSRLLHYYHYSDREKIPILMSWHNQKEM